MLAAIRSRTSSQDTLGTCVERDRDRNKDRTEKDFDNGWALGTSRSSAAASAMELITVPARSSTGSRITLSTKEVWLSVSVMGKDGGQLESTRYVIEFQYKIMFA